MNGVIEPHPDLYIHLSKVLNVYKLNLKDIDYIYNELYHLIPEFESVRGFTTIRDSLLRGSKRKYYEIFFNSLKKIVTPPEKEILNITNLINE